MFQSKASQITFWILALPLSAYLSLGGKLGLTWRGLPLSVWKPLICPTNWICEGTETLVETKILINFFIWIIISILVFAYLKKRNKRNISTNSVYTK